MKKIFELIFLMLIVNSVFILSSCEENEKQPTDNQEIVSENNFYQNPICPIVDGDKLETYMADPYVIRDDDGKYYLYCTQTDVYVTSADAGRTFKRGPIFSSVNGVDWFYVGDVFENYTPIWGTKNAGVWAPTVCKVGEYYMYYYSLSTGGDTNPGIGVARSNTPYGPWEHFGKLFNSEEIGVTNSIDPYVFYDNEKLYIAWGSFGGLITIAELEENGLSLKGGIEEQREKKVAIAGYERFEANNYEGTIIIKKDGRYYLFLSTGTVLSGENSTYHVVVASSDNLFGPYLDSKGRDMFGPNRGDTVIAPSRTGGVVGVGHNGFLVDDLGDIWMVYHGYNLKSENHSDWRILFMDKLLWNDSGLPYVDKYRASNDDYIPGPYITDIENMN